MKKLALLSVLAACVVASSLEPVHAASELETWCVAQGAIWQAGTDTCIILSAIDATVTGTLALLSGEILSNHGTINNDGDIYNDGIIDNFGTIGNHGYIHNANHMYNYNGGIIDNDGTIDNGGTIYNYNYGTISNYGAVDNDGTIYNYGTFYNLCMAVFLGSPPSDRIGGVTYNLDNCSFMPMVARG